MLVLDTSAQQNWQQAAKVESSAALRQKALIDELQSNSISVGDDAGRDTSSLLAQMGRPLASQEVQRRLHLCNPKLIFERSAAYPELTGVYIEKDERLPTGGWQKRKVHLLGMESGIMPEFSVLHKTTKQVANPELFGKEKPQRDIDWVNVPTFASETRGWRTVLVRLLHLGLIVQMDVEKYFDWTPSQQSEKWYNMTR
jgi:hypothetical protein